MLDVGSGPGALTTALVERFGADAVAAADPSEPFVAAARERHPGVRVELAPAEDLPFADDAFAAALAQLVVHFMTDPVAGLREMARVTRAGGVVAACVWDLAGGESPLSVFWSSARQLDPDAIDESRLAGAREGHLAELFDAAGARPGRGRRRVTRRRRTVRSTSGGSRSRSASARPAATWRASARSDRVAVRDLCREAYGDGPFTMSARAWAARGVV